MKRLIYRLIVGLITFTIGLSLPSIWNSSHSKLDFVSEIDISADQIHLSEPIGYETVVSVCDIDSYPESYLGKRILLPGLNDAKDSQTWINGPMYCSGKWAEVTIKLSKNPKPPYVSQSADPCINDMYEVGVIGYLEPIVEKENSRHHYHMTDAHIVRLDRCF